MSRTYEYRSGLASQISAFIAEKRACGCKYEKEAKTFQTLDRFLVEQGINTLYFVGQAEGKTIWNVYRYALDTQGLAQLTFPKQPDRIIDIQITHQPCGPDFSRGCCVLEDEGLKK